MALYTGIAIGEVNDDWQVGGHGYVGLILILANRCREQDHVSWKEMCLIPGQQSINTES